jgi:hypothetical protein
MASSDPELEGLIGKGVQLCRISHPELHFEELADLGSLPGLRIGCRRVWRLKGTGVLYALLTLPYKDEELILVRAAGLDWTEWDWGHLAEIADGCRWRGPGLDGRWIDS